MSFFFGGLERQNADFCELASVEKSPGQTASQSRSLGAQVWIATVHLGDERRGDGVF